MLSVLTSLLLTVRASVRARAAPPAPGAATQTPSAVQLTRADRLLWVWLSRFWHGWRTTVVIVKPEPSSPGIPAQSPARQAPSSYPARNTAPSLVSAAHRP